MGTIERIQVSPKDRERLENLIRDRNTLQKVLRRSRRRHAARGVQPVEGRHPSAPASGQFDAPRKAAKRYAILAKPGLPEKWKCFLLELPHVFHVPRPRQNDAVKPHVR
jgi:hypothetical protein